MVSNRIKKDDKKFEELCQDKDNILTSIWEWLIKSLDMLISLNFSSRENPTSKMKKERDNIAAKLTKIQNKKKDR